jgi:hypothetical protein
MMVYWINYAFSTISKGPETSYVWRVPTIMQCIFLFPMVLIVLIIPETPRWLAGHDRNEECYEVLKRMHKGKMTDMEIKAEYDMIVGTVALESSAGASSWKDLFRADGKSGKATSMAYEELTSLETVVHTRRRFLIACGIQIFQQLGGINALICKLAGDPLGCTHDSDHSVDYAGALFQNSLGFDANTSGLMAGFLNTWFFLASFIPWFLIDRFGRRPLVSGCPSIFASGLRDVLTLRTSFYL